LISVSQKRRFLSNRAGLKRNPAPERDRWTFYETINLALSK
jgi:hypothetical protein